MRTIHQAQSRCSSAITACLQLKFIVKIFSLQGYESVSGNFAHDFSKKAIPSGDIDVEVNDFER